MAIFSQVVKYDQVVKYKIPSKPETSGNDEANFSMDHFYVSTDRTSKEE